MLREERKKTETSNGSKSAINIVSRVTWITKQETQMEENDDLPSGQRIWELGGGGGGSSMARVHERN